MVRPFRIDATRARPILSRMATTRLLCAVFAVGCSAGGAATSDDVDSTGGAGGGGGTPDFVEAPCDGELELEGSASDAAMAIGLCGGVAARWVMPDGSDAPADAAQALGHAILETTGAGIAPTHGERFLALSSGYAGPIESPEPEPSQCRETVCDMPTGLPRPFEGCTGDADALDGMGLELELTAPPGARGLAFDLLLMTRQLDACGASRVFAATMGHTDYAPPGTEAGVLAWELTAAPGTWTTVSTPIEPGDSFALQLAVWDVGDCYVDSTLLVDGVRWIGAAP